MPSIFSSNQPERAAETAAKTAETQEQFAEWRQGLNILERAEFDATQPYDRKLMLQTTTSDVFSTTLQNDREAIRTFIIAMKKYDFAPQQLSFGYPATIYKNGGLLPAKSNLYGWYLRRGMKLSTGGSIYESLQKKPLPFTRIKPVPIGLPHRVVDRSRYGPTYEYSLAQLITDEITIRLRQ